ncbi:hypothetical protein D187_007754 [Cystobacter fuscus DSM 2262]|uniref:Uncharacterized protein n=1 Tax=Cystobacter fuscus (strain ATCC 25194 / DSM 2262 / NBRC 100088 / M29) TaxID=1242864 RepID=S9P2B3_CYSF2|nr:hypothetical protein D187_007754 [Cystobacter fuscus DSM 2262]
MPREFHGACASQPEAEFVAGVFASLDTGAPARKHQQGSPFWFGSYRLASRSGVAHQSARCGGPRQ